MAQKTIGRHRVQTRLQRVRRLGLVGQLASGVVHDFNNLLTVILGSGEMAQMRLPANHVAQEDLARITEAARQAADLARQVMAIGKPDESKAGRIDLNHVVRRTLDLLHGTLVRSVRVETYLSDQEICVRASEVELQRVLANLCINAQEAMPRGGRIIIRTAVRPSNNLHDSSVADWAWLSVADTGEGMSEEVRGRLFQPFFSTKQRGSGLGLAMARQITASYGGRIDVWSAPRMGSCFDIWLPRS